VNHGYTDRLTDAQGRLTALHLTLLTDETIDIARGLGDSVTVAGLSIGGTMTAWAAQHRTDVDRAVVLAPLFGVKALPSALHAPIANATYIVPNLFIWWDANLREKTTPVYAYPRFATHGIGAVLRLSDAVWQGATQYTPGARSFIVITSPGDEAIDNTAAALMAAAWQAHGSDRVTTYQLPDNLGLRHDVIDPNQPYQRVAEVYPILLKLIMDVGR
jgi:pimeloyl-ACP methyl ester carboxylesterase